jgi:hypothetical protein
MGLELRVGYFFDPFFNVIDTVGCIGLDLDVSK